jgi:maltose O-acetyltransferase
MLAGEPCRSRDPELLAMYHRARDLLGRFAGASSHDVEARHAVLRQLFGSIGARSWIEPPFHCDYGENIRIGSDCFVNANCVFLDCNTITIGSNVLFGPAVQLYTAMHPLLACTDRLRRHHPAHADRGW